MGARDARTSRVPSQRRVAPAGKADSSTKNESIVPGRMSQRQRQLLNLRRSPQAHQWGNQHHAVQMDSAGESAGPPAGLAFNDVAVFEVEDHDLFGGGEPIEGPPPRGEVAQ